MKLSSPTRNSNSVTFGMTETSRTIMMIAILTMGYCQLVVADELPSIQLPDTPSSDSSTTIAPTTVPTPPVGGVTLDSPTITPTSISATVPSANLSPTTNTSTTVQPTITSTFEPTTTAFPTISAAPTLTRNPTSSECNICVNGTITTNDVIPLGDVGNLTCVDAVAFGVAGQISSNNCVVIQELLTETGLCSCRRPNSTTTASDVPSSTPTFLYDPCNICGEGYYVSNDEGILMLRADSTEQVTCGFVNQGGIAGILAPEACDFMQNQTSPLNDRDNNKNNPCGCMAGTMPPVSPYCHVCGDTRERVTKLDAIVDIPQDVLDTLPNATNVSASLFTCAYVEEQFKTTQDAIVCEFLQMEVLDVCQCQVPTMAPVTPTPSVTGSPVAANTTAGTDSPVTTNPTAGTDSPVTTNTTDTSLACDIPSHRWNILAITLALLYITMS